MPVLKQKLGCKGDDEGQLEPTFCPTQPASPQPQIKTGSEACTKSVEAREDGSEKIAEPAGQALGAGSVLRPAPSAAWLGTASHATISRRTNATGASFRFCIG